MDDHSMAADNKCSLFMNLLVNVLHTCRRRTAQTLKTLWFSNELKFLRNSPHFIAEMCNLYRSQELKVLLNKH